MIHNKLIGTSTLTQKIKKKEIASKKYTHHTCYKLLYVIYDNMKKSNEN
jgi:hypothetical protein